MTQSSSWKSVCAHSVIPSLRAMGCTCRRYPPASAEVPRHDGLKTFSPSWTKVVQSIVGETQSAKCANAADELDQRGVSRILRGQSSIAVVLTIESVSNLRTDGICVFLSKDDEPRTE